MAAGKIPELTETVEFEALVARLDASGIGTGWFGRASESTIQDLEKLLGVALPPSFRSFLEFCGGGLAGDESLAGVIEGDPEDTSGGLVWSDTVECRKRHGLPPNLVVVYYDSDEVVWCLDTARRDERGECPVVNYDAFTKSVDGDLAPDFFAFFEEFVTLRENW